MALGPGLGLHQQRLSGGAVLPDLEVSGDSLLTEVNRLLAPPPSCRFTVVQFDMAGPSPRAVVQLDWPPGMRRRPIYARGNRTEPPSPGETVQSLFRAIILQTVTMFGPQIEAVRKRS